jgi:hypothetical protein
MTPNNPNKTESMKKLAILSAILIIAAGTVWYLNYSGQKNSSTNQGLDYSSNPHAKELISQIDALESNQWNKEQFDKILSKIDIKHSRDKISDTDKHNLEEGLYSAYAKSLHLSFESWKDYCAKTSVNKLYQEIKLSRKYDALCEEILSQAYSEINGYYQILNVTKKVGQLIQEEFEESSFNSLEKKVQKLPSYFSACSQIREKIDVAREKLAIYHEFVQENIDNYSAYEFELKIGETTYPTLQKLKANYKLAQKQGFDFYEKKLKTDGFDN